MSQRNAQAEQRRPRLFIAAELPALVTELLGEVIHHLRGQGVEGVRWVRPEGVHLTLKFLGETPEERLEAIAQAMAQAAVQTPPFALNIQGVGAFPNLRAPQVVWLGLSGQVEVLKELQSALEQTLEQAGFPREGRAFSPHLTLGRVNGRLTPGQLQALSAGLKGAGAVEFPEVSVDAMSLIESLLERSGARYVQRAVVRLGRELA
ncbi:MAG: RNA 2',3'-cyclic phosphodiesterase [Chloroflexi bacterium]|nr:RNA 2',3'-cyclic phosphodiesterase [Chloroflexota bacterium]